MLNDFLKEMVVYVTEKPVEEIAVLLNNKKHVNEFNIAKKLDLTINQTRNILYKLSDYGLVSSIRKKDKKKGWYTYFWKIEVLKSLEFLKNILDKKIADYNKQIKIRNSHQFYICERCNIELDEEHALLNGYTCNECGDVLTIKNNSRLLRDLGRNLDKAENKLKLIDVEIIKEQEKLDKIKVKELKKIEKEKAEKRAIKREEARLRRAKNPVKKKVVKKKAVKKKTTKKKAVKKKPVKKKAVKKKVVKKKVVKKKAVKKKPVKKKAVKKKVAKKKK